MLNKYNITPTVKGPYYAAKGKSLLVKQAADGSENSV
jgi:hypothetical protein